MSGKLPAILALIKLPRNSTKDVGRLGLQSCTHTTLYKSKHGLARTLISLLFISVSAASYVLVN